MKGLITDGSPVREPGAPALTSRLTQLRDEHPRPYPRTPGTYE